MKQVLYQHKEPFEDTSFPVGVFLNEGYHYLILPHYHDHLEYLKIIKGSVEVTLDKETFVANKGDIIFINSIIIHSVKGIENSEATTVSIVFHKHFLSCMPERLENDLACIMLLNSAYRFLVFQQSNQLWHLLDKSIEVICDEMIKTDLGYQMIVRSQLSYMTGQIIRFYKDGFLKSSNNNKKQTHDLNLVFNYINVHFNEKINVDQLSSILHISKYHFCRIFKKMVGKTIFEYIRDVRINFTIHLLLDTTYTINEIAEMAGFQNSCYFIRVFKKYKGDKSLKI